MWYECQNCGRAMDTEDGYADGLCDHCYHRLDADGSLAYYQSERDAVREGRIRRSDPDDPAHG